jgi:ketosteroid isomerase-like protein
MHAIRSLAAIGLAALLGVTLSAQTPNGAQTAVAAVVSSFHAALKSGDAAAAARLLAPDAVLLEAGGIETRAEYLANHLPADIEFERVVSSTRAPSRIVVTGDTAWAVTSGEWQGAFQGRPVSFVGVESMVLSRAADGWRIRAIHWSSRNRLPPPPAPSAQ